MLKLDRVDFTYGRSSFRDATGEFYEPTAKIFVKVCLEDRFDSAFYAQVDTGAAWSVLDHRLAQRFGLLSPENPGTQISTRFGLLKGSLVRPKITFVAEEGVHLDTFATFFVSPDWPSGLNFLGYSGLLDSIRFALDPQKNHFYFGPSA